jgi:hypothetical protein
MVPTGFEDPHAASPTHSKVIVSGETRPSTACVPIVDIMFPPSHLRSATIQILAVATLTKVEDILPKQAMAVGDRIIGRYTPATCTHNIPSIGSVGTTVPEEHASMTTMLKHFESD